MSLPPPSPVVNLISLVSLPSDPPFCFSTFPENCCKVLVNQNSISMTDFDLRKLPMALFESFNKHDSLSNSASSVSVDQVPYVVSLKGDCLIHWN